MLVRKFGKAFAHRVKAVRRKASSTWHLDELFITLHGTAIPDLARGR